MISTVFADSYYELDCTKLYDYRASVIAFVCTAAESRGLKSYATSRECCWRRSYRNDYQSRYDYNSASSSHTRGSWSSGSGYGMRQSNYPPSEYHRHNNYDNRQQSSRNNYNQNAQHGYHSQRRNEGGFAEEPLREMDGGCKCQVAKCTPPAAFFYLTASRGPGVLPPGVEPPCSGGLPLLALELPVLPPTRAPHAFP
ncbi:hypothetical protein ALC62_08402 [Cyphomyrmex costatus]|uniref:Uncharacterized protein n=1 Tax=Cyphomyrmex costatus TaxID=456900 RepID=A0A195CJ18_9HYME|nr:hypothetical protein ALC62_08402 [Cyphomyrmex costatus]